MRERLKLLGYFVLFWLGFQVIIRAVFLVYNHDFSQQLTASEIVLTFVHGLKMDGSISGYFLMMTSLLLAISVFTPSVRWLFYTVNIFTVIALLFSCIVVVVDLELYRHWGFRLNTTPLFYMGSEAAGSVDLLVALKLSLLLVSLFAIAVWLYSRWLAPKIGLLPRAEKKTFPVLAVTTGLLFIPIRGSFTVAPMNTGFVYFHKTKAFANHAAINVVWNFLYSLSNTDVVYPENLVDTKKAEDYFTSLHPPGDSTTYLFNTARPNIILFILESFTADVIEPLGGVKDIAPNLSQLCHEGILFDNFYASGDRTDKGIVSILSSYPAQPRTSIIKYPAKTQHLPYLNRHMQGLGYKTSFVYGGDVDWANFRSYLTNCRFDHITSEDDFPDEINESKWGVHDHFVLEKAFAQCDTATAPFFKVILTLSSHEPFDVPMQPFIKGNDQESLFLNACHYTDKSVGEFIRKAKEKPWWKNSVVIFVADHGHRYPRNKEIKDKERFRIPLLMVGGAIKKDTVIHTYGNQTDLANTLLAQLDSPKKEFRFSNNLMSPQAPSFAAYFFNDGYGFVTPRTYIIHDNTGKQFLRSDSATAEDLEMSKAYLQTLYIDYNNR